MFCLWSRRIASSSLKKRTVSRPFSLSRAPIDVSPEVQHGLKSGSAIVALESAIITHGMPYPSNLETAIVVEQQVRLTGSIPATIGVLDGRIVVGLQKKQLEILSDKSTTENIKISRRDLAAAVGLKRSGGTTISATSLIASLVGIRIFSTGGLGGVHRGGEISWDVSADLTELGRTPIAVVSAGAKSILDIGRTLEYLETQGVAVFTYGPNHEFPGFYSPRSGFQSPWFVNSPQEAAAIIDASHRLGLRSGMLFAAPIPEEFAGAAYQIQIAVDQAVKESEENGMSKRGKEVTPWILGRVAELTGGKSIPNNIALIKNTAYIGGMIAAEYARLAKSEEKDRRDEIMNSFGGDGTRSSIVELPPSDILVIGSAAVDVISQPSTTQTSLPGHTTNPGKVAFTLGGVARNIAEAAHRVALASNSRASVLLVSPIGKDLPGNLILANTQRLGMRSDGFISQDDSLKSAVCNMHLDINGELTAGVADMTIVQNLAADPIIQIIKKHKPKLVAFDANLNSETISSIVQNCVQCNIPTFFEPTSVTKSLSIVPALELATGLRHKLTSLVTFISPNRLELSHLFQEIHSGTNGITSTPHWWSVMDDLNLGETYRSDLALLSRQPTQSGLLNPFLTGLPQMTVALIPFFQHLFIKCGENGLFVAMRITNGTAVKAWSKERTRPEKWQLVAKGHDSILLLKHYPARPLHGPILNVTGAGDSLVGSLLADLTQCENLAPESLDNIVHRAQHAAILSLYSPEAVSPLLSKAPNSPLS